METTTLTLGIPDVAVTREFFATEGDIVIERAHAKATHGGELLGMEPTGRPATNR